MQNPCLNPTADQTYEVIGEGPYNFAKVLARTREMERAGNVEEACNERFQAFQRFAELVPEDEEVNLEWNHRNSRAALELIRASAIDHFLINDFEMSAALLELLLELDPEDHLEGSELLAFDYLAMDEQAASKKTSTNPVAEKRILYPSQTTGRSGSRCVRPQSVVGKRPCQKRHIRRRPRRRRTRDRTNCLHAISAGIRSRHHPGYRNGIQSMYAKR